MKISVITATYNREKTVERTLLSIKNQTHTDIQIVVIDGLSHDDTVSLAIPFLNENDILQSESDLGIYDALNKGVALAEGEIIAFLHSDDLYFDDNVLSRVAEVFSDDNIDLVYGNASFFREDNVEKTIRVYCSDELSVKNLAWGKMPAHTAMFFRKRVYETFGVFKTNYSIGGDYEFLCRMATQANLNITRIPDCLVKMQTGGISTGGIKNTITLNKEVLRACAENGIYTNILMVLSKYPSKLLQFIKL